MGCSTRGEMIMADISVPYWNIVDVNMLCEGARLIGFDLDNTLARSKKPMKADMAECFSALTSLIDVAVITGGKYSLLQSQVVDRLSDHADKSKLHLMPTSGTRYYRWDGQRWGKVFSHDLSDVLLPDKPGELCRVSGIIAGVNGNVIKLEHNQFVSINRSAAVELRITLEAFGTEHKKEIIAALEKEGYQPKVVRANI